MEKPGLLDWAIAPLTWVERARGRKRLGLLVLYGMTVLVVGMLGWRWLSLWGLPDIGEPFDVDRYGMVALPDSANAMVLYREAAEKLIFPVPANYKVASTKSWDNHDWSTADPEVRRWVLDNRLPFEVWLRGTERPESLFVQPRDLGEETPIVPLVALQRFASLARLKASQLEAGGDVEGAWKLLRAALRSSRHVGMHGTMMQRAIGRDILVRVEPDILRWADAPGVTPEMLRRAITDVEACKAMTPPNSDMFRADYFAMRSLIDREAGSPGRPFVTPGDDGHWYSRLPIAPMTRKFFRREPERSHRVHRLIVAGVLAWCDRPGATRPKLVSPRWMIYELDPSKPPADAPIVPEDLVRWVDRSDYGRLSGGLAVHFPRIEAETSTFDAMLLKMAEHAFELEHGQPPKTYGELLGPYLKALPDGFAPSDQVAPTTGSN
jgi:hypothetical protein